MHFRFVRVEHPQYFNTMEEAIGEANAIKATLRRYTNSYNVPLTAVICVSEHDIRTAEAFLMISKKPGRPKKEIVSKMNFNKEPEKERPHLHIILCYENTFEECILNKISSSILKRLGKKLIASDYSEEEIEDIVSTPINMYLVPSALRYIKYAMKQSSVIRYVNDFTGTINFNFQNLHKLFIKKKRIYFHKNCRTKMAKSITIQRHEET